MMLINDRHAQSAENDDIAPISWILLETTVQNEGEN